MTDRAIEVFEEVSPQFYMGLSFDKNCDGEYQSYTTRCAFLLWCGCQAHTRKEVIEECKQKLKSIPPMIVDDSDIDYCIAELNDLLSQPTKG